jgi:hypothetical protein
MSVDVINQNTATILESNADFKYAYGLGSTLSTLLLLGRFYTCGQGLRKNLIKDILGIDLGRKFLGVMYC